MKGPQNFAALNPRSVSSQNLRQNVCGDTDPGEVEINRTADAVTDVRILFGWFNLVGRHRPRPPVRAIYGEYPGFF